MPRHPNQTPVSRTTKEVSSELESWINSGLNSDGYGCRDNTLNADSGLLLTGFSEPPGERCFKPAFVAPKAVARSRREATRLRVCEVSEPRCCAIVVPLLAHLYSVASK